MELRNYAGALQWCDEGLGLIPTETKLQELRATADKQKVESPSRRIFFFWECAPPEVFQDVDVFVF